MSQRHYFPEGFICGINYYVFLSLNEMIKEVLVMLQPLERSNLFFILWKKVDLLRNSHISITISNAREIIFEKFSISCWNIKFYVFSEWLIKGNALILKIDKIAIDYFLQ